MQTGRFYATINGDVGAVDAYPKLRGGVNWIIIAPVNVEAVDHGNVVWIGKDVVPSCGPIFAVVSPTSWDVVWQIPDGGLLPDVSPTLLGESLDGRDIRNRRVEVAYDRNGHGWHLL